MRIRMLQTTTGSYDGTHTKEYEIGQEYSVGRDLISKDLADSFLASNAAVEVQEIEPKEGQTVPHESLHTSTETEPVVEGKEKSPEKPNFPEKPATQENTNFSEKPAAQEKPNFPDRPKK